MADSWTFLTNHLQVLIVVDREPDIRLRDLAVQVGVTERTAQGIVADLTRAGYLSVSRIGRRNSYRVHAATPCRDAAQRQHPVSVLLGVLSSRSGGVLDAELRPGGPERSVAV